MTAKNDGSATPSSQEHQRDYDAQLGAGDAKASQRFGFESIRRDLNAHWRVYVLALSTCMAGMLFGWDTGLIGGLLDLEAFQNDFGVRGKPVELADLKGTVVSVLQAGCTIGAATGLYLPSRFGRKPTMIFASIIFLIGSIVQTCCRLHDQTPSAALTQLYFGRAIGGYGVGLSSAVVPTYLSECAPRSVRGRLAGAYQLLNVTGIALSFFVNYGLVSTTDDHLSSSLWRIPFALQMLPGVLFTSTILFQPESPRWLVEQGRSADSARSLSIINRLPLDHPTVTGIVAEIEADLEGKAKLSFFKQLQLTFSDKVTCYRVLTGSILMLAQQMSGTNAVNVYAPQIFRTLGVTGSASSLLATGVYGIVKMVTTGLFLFIAIEQLGRKWCLILGGLIQVFCLLWVAIYQAIRPAGSSTHVDGVGYLTIAMIYIYVVGYGLGWSSVTWAVSAEVAPSHLRSMAMGFATIVQWAMNLAVVKFTPVALVTIKWKLFLIFAICLLAAVVWAALLLPETSGLTLESIGRSYEGNILSRSVQDLFPSKRRVFRARMLAETGGTADDGGQIRELEHNADYPRLDRISGATDPLQPTETNKSKGNDTVVVSERGSIPSDRK